MKRVERMAEEHRDRNSRKDAPDGCVAGCFEAGFRAARELAAQRLERLMDFLSPRDEDGDFIRPIQHAQYDLRMLGEDEVGDGA